MMAPPTATMLAVGLNFPDVLDIAQHCVNLLESQGRNAMEIVKNMLKLVKAVSGRDLPTIFTALGELRGDVAELAAAIRLEFGLN
jgi:hypothetical protein